MPNIKRGMMGAAGAGGAGGYQLWGAGNNSDGALATGETTNSSNWRCRRLGIRYFQ